MKTISNVLILKHDSNTILALIMAVFMVFLQSGYSYYLSNQIILLSLIVWMLLVSSPSVVNNRHFFILVFIFPLFILSTVLFLPDVASRNSQNILMTFLGITIYSIMLILFICLRFKYTLFILSVFRLTSGFTITILAMLIVLTDSNMFSYLDRSLLLLQNSDLVTNYSSLEVLQNDVRFREKNDLEPRLDLFYGEASYLAIVLFVCSVCFMLTSKIMMDVDKSVKENIGIGESLTNGVYYKIVIFLGVLCLLYIKSLSSIIYGTLVLFYISKDLFLREMTAFKRATLLLLSLMAFLGSLGILIDSYEYVLFRISTMHESISASQRFGSINVFGLSDYLFGLTDLSKIPEEGFHNSLFYVIAISGLGGLYYLGFMLTQVYVLSGPVKMRFILLMLVLAVIVQNGAIFSPNKAVLLALIFLPLSCSRSMFYAGTKSVGQEAYVR